MAAMDSRGPGLDRHYTVQILAKTGSTHPCIVGISSIRVLAFLVCKINFCVPELIKVYPALMYFRPSTDLDTLALSTCVSLSEL